MISSQLNNTHTSKLFARTKRETPRFVFILFLSFMLIIADAHYHCMHPLRHFFSYITLSLQYIADSPVRFSEWGKSLWVSKQKLIHENQQLSLNHLTLQVELQHLQKLRNENAKLKALLSLSEVVEQKSIAARVLSVDTSTIKHTLTLDKGKHDHVFIGQPVLDQQGVLGQVIEVGLMTSTVLLISDNMSAVPVKNNRTGEMGILAGTHDKNKLELLHLPKTSFVVANDLLITSGLGGRYPEGYPVGRVTEVINLPGDDFIKVRVAPIASLDKSSLVLLIWPNERHSLIARHMDNLNHWRSYL